MAAATTTMAPQPPAVGPITDNAKGGSSAVKTSVYEEDEPGPCRPSHPRTPPATARALSTTIASSVSAAAVVSPDGPSPRSEERAVSGRRRRRQEQGEGGDDDHRVLAREAHSLLRRRRHGEAAELYGRALSALRRQLPSPSSLCGGRPTGGNDDGNSSTADPPGGAAELLLRVDEAAVACNLALCLRRENTAKQHHTGGRDNRADAARLYREGADIYRLCHGALLLPSRPRGGGASGDDRAPARINAGARKRSNGGRGQPVNIEARIVKALKGSSDAAALAAESTHEALRGENDGLGMEGAVAGHEEIVAFLLAAAGDDGRAKDDGSGGGESSYCNQALLDELSVSQQPRGHPRLDASAAAAAQSPQPPRPPPPRFVRPTEAHRLVLISRSLNDLGSLHLRRNDIDAAAASHADALDLVRGALAESPRVGDKKSGSGSQGDENARRLPLLREVVRTLHGKAELCMVLNDANGEVEALREALRTEDAVLFASAAVGGSSAAKGDNKAPPRGAAKLDEDAAARTALALGRALASRSKSSSRSDDASREDAREAAACYDRALGALRPDAEVSAAEYAEALEELEELRRLGAAVRSLSPSRRRRSSNEEREEKQRVVAITVSTAAATEAAVDVSHADVARALAESKRSNASAIANANAAVNDGGGNDEESEIELLGSLSKGAVNENGDATPVPISANTTPTTSRGKTTRRRSRRRHRRQGTDTTAEDDSHSLASDNDDDAKDVAAAAAAATIGAGERKDELCVDRVPTPDDDGIAQTPSADSHYNHVWDDAVSQLSFPEGDLMPTSTKLKESATSRGGANDVIPEEEDDIDLAGKDTENDRKRDDGDDDDNSSEGIHATRLGPDNNGGAGGAGAAGWFAALPNKLPVNLSSAMDALVEVTEDFLGEAMGGAGAGAEDGQHRRAGSGADERGGMPISEIVIDLAAAPQFKAKAKAQAVLASSSPAEVSSSRDDGAGGGGDPGPERKRNKGAAAGRVATAADIVAAAAAAAAAAPSSLKPTTTQEPLQALEGGDGAGTPPPSSPQRSLPAARALSPARFNEGVEVCELPGVGDVLVPKHLNATAEQAGDVVAGHDADADDQDNDDDDNDDDDDLLGRMNVVSPVGADENGEVRQFADVRGGVYAYTGPVDLDGDGENDDKEGTNLGLAAASSLDAADSAEQVRALTEALRERRSRLGPDHPAVAELLPRIALVFRRKGAAKKAEGLLVEAARILRGVLAGARHDGGGLDKSGTGAETSGWDGPKGRVRAARHLSEALLLLGDIRSDIGGGPGSDAALSAYAEALSVLGSATSNASGNAEEGPAASEILRRMGSAFLERGDYERSMRCFERALRALMGRSAPVVVGGGGTASGPFDAEEGSAGQRRSFWRQPLGPEVCRTLIEFGAAYYRERNAAGILPLQSSSSAGEKEHDAVCASASDIKPTHSEDFVRYVQSGALMLMAAAHEERGEYADAMRFLEETLQRHRNHQGGGVCEEDMNKNESNRFVSHLLNRIGMLSLRTGQYDEALERHREALSIQRRLLRSSSSAGVQTALVTAADVADTTTLVGEAEMKRGRYRKALSAFESALPAQRKAAASAAADGEKTASSGALLHADADAALAATLRGVGSAHDELFEHGRATACLEEALRLQRKIGHSSNPSSSPADAEWGDGDGPEALKTRLRLGKVQLARAEHDAALSTFKDILMARRALYGVSHPDVAEAIHCVGVCHAKRGEMSDAMDAYKKCYALRLKLLGHDHPDVAVTLNSIGAVHASAGRRDRALSIYEDALALKRESLGDEHVEISRTLVNQGSVLAKLGKHAEAMAKYTEALHMRQESLGTRHPAVADVHANIGNIHMRRCAFGEASVRFDMALTIYRSKLAEDHPKVTGTLRTIERVKRDEQLCV